MLSLFLSLSRETVTTVSSTAESRDRTTQNNGAKFIGGGALVRPACLLSSAMGPVVSNLVTSYRVGTPGLRRRSPCWTNLRESKHRQTAGPTERQCGSVTAACYMLFTLARRARTCNLLAGNFHCHRRFGEPRTPHARVQFKPNNQRPKHR